MFILLKDLWVSSADVQAAFSNAALPDPKRQKQLADCCLGTAHVTMSSGLDGSCSPASHLVVGTPQDSLAHHVPQG